MQTLINTFPPAPRPPPCSLVCDRQGRRQPDARAPGQHQLPDRASVAGRVGLAGLQLGRRQLAGAVRRGGQGGQAVGAGRGGRPCGRKWMGVTIIQVAMERNMSGCSKSTCAPANVDGRGKWPTAPI